MQRTLGKKLAILLIVGIVVYALAGFLLAPRVIERALKAMVQQEPGLTLEVASTSVNPFTLALTATNVNLFTAENKAIIALGRVDADLQVGSLFERAWIVRTLSIDQASVMLDVADGGSNAALRLLDAFWRSLVGNSGSGRNRIDHLDIRRSEMQVLSPAHTGGLSETVISLADLELEMHDLGTTSPAPFDLTATADGYGPGFSWSVAELQSNAAIDTRHGQAQIDTLRLENPQIRFERDSAVELALLMDPREAPLTIGMIEVVGGEVDFVDQSVTPAVRLAADEVAGSISHNSLDGEPAFSLSLRGRLAATGSGEIIAEWQPSRARDATRIDVRLENVPLSPVSTYLAETIGRRISAGDIDLALQVLIEDERLSLDNRIAVRELRLGERVLTPAAVDLPLELAVALLENSEGVIDFQVPVEQRPVTAGSDPAALFAQAFADYVIELTSNPFENLAGLTGEADMDLGSIEFFAGSAEITDETAAKLTVLDSVLEQRPRLGLIAYPGYDPVIDREALARQQIRLHVVLATSSRPPGQAADESIDFADSKVHSVLEEFAANRLSAERQAAIDRRFSDRDAMYYRAVFDALVTNEEVGAATLNRLAGFRARSVIGALAASGNEDGRLRQAATIEATTTVGDRAIVRLEVQAVEPATP